MDDQLAEPVLSLAEGLKQGSPAHESVHPEGRAAGVGSWETKISGIQMKSAEPSILYDLGFFIDKN